MTKTHQITIHDSTLRDGQHAVHHQLTLEQMRLYAEAANAAGVPVIEVGHGNGLGASSLQVGLALSSDLDMMKTVRQALNQSRMAVFMLPGWGTTRDLDQAIAEGADVIRIGAHCTEYSVTERYLEHARKAGVEAQGILLMSHMASPKQLADACVNMQNYGAQAVGIFDSSGHYLPDDVTKRIAAIREAVDVSIIYHSHNNLCMAVANSIAASKAGANILDACARGFGAGAGNTQIEVLVPVLHRLGFETGIELYGLLDAADIAECELMPTPSTVTSTSIVSGLAGVFSGFKSKVTAVATEMGIDPRDIFFELGRLQVIAGQEDLIIDVALALSKRQKNADEQTCQN